MRKLKVRLDWGDEQVVVGTLAEQDRRVYFEYDRGFLQASTERRIAKRIAGLTP